VYTTKSGQARQTIYNSGGNIFQYKISRLARRQTLGISQTIPYEPEEYYMRYNITPYYVSFDMVSLFLSFLYKSKDNMEKFIGTIKDTLYSKAFQFYMMKANYEELIRRYQALEDKYDGNFGKLIFPLLNVADQASNLYMFNHIINRNQYKFINTLYLTNKNKIGTSIAFCPLVASTQSSTDSIINNVPITTTALYDTLQIQVNPIILNAGIRIEYSTDYALMPGFLERKVPQIIVRTNRYSYTETGSKFIYEFDSIEENKEQIEFILATTQQQNNI
jgi:hypothetical protein